MLIFVYGTLKRGCCNHHLLDTSQFVDEGSTLDLHSLYLGPDIKNPDGPDIPYLFTEPNPGDPACKVWGEVWEVTHATLEKLDELEGTPDWYRREKTSVRLSSGQPLEVYTYLCPRKPMDTLRLIKSGRF